MNWIVMPLVVAFVVGFAGTWWVRRYAVRRALLDIPNDRSSHTAPTPRGGGLSIAIVVLASILALGLAEYLPAMLLVALLPACLLVVIIGWLDDHRPLPALVRGMSYLIAAAWFVWFVGGLGSISMGGHTLVQGGKGSLMTPHPDLPPQGGKETGAGSGLSPAGGKETGVGTGLSPQERKEDRDATDWIASRSLAMTSERSSAMTGGEGGKERGMSVILISILLVIGIAWLTNLYNFMDGTDGLAGLQGLLAGAAGGGLLWLQGGMSLALLAWMTAAACAGFLVWNWAPAKIFMGDVGSCLLGFLFACLAVLGEKYAGLPLLLWVILLGFFIWDATLTLLMRVSRREKWYDAHKSHAYQRLVQIGCSHARLALLFAALNLLVLWPLAWWGYQSPRHLLLVTGLSILINGLIWMGSQVYYKRMTTKGLEQC